MTYPDLALALALELALEVVALVLDIDWEILAEPEPAAFKFRAFLLPPGFLVDIDKRS